jgi:hypothetical protein
MSRKTWLQLLAAAVLLAIAIIQFIPAPPV